MNKYFFSMPLFVRIALIVFIFYLAIDSLLLEKRYSVIDFTVLFLFMLFLFVSGAGGKYKLFFVLALVSVFAAVFFSLFNAMSQFDFAIRNFSEWVFLLMSVGVVSDLIKNNLKK